MMAHLHTSSSTGTTHYVSAARNDDGTSRTVCGRVNFETPAAPTLSDDAATCRSCRRIQGENVGPSVASRKLRAALADSADDAGMGTLVPCDEPCNDSACLDAAADRASLAERAAFAIGQRVGILTGLQSAGGAWIGSYGTVKGAVETWTNVIEYSVIADGESEAFLYREYLLRAVEPTPVYDEVSAAFLTDSGTDEGGSLQATDMPAYNSGRDAGLSPVDAAARALSMRRHPAGKARPVQIKGSHVVGGLAVTRSTHRDPLTGGAVFACDVPELDAFPGIAQDDGRPGIVKSGGSLYFRLF